MEDGKVKKGYKPQSLYLSRPEYQQFPLDVFRDHIYNKKDQEKRKKARFEKMKLRAKFLKPHQTVLPPEVEKEVRAGGKVLDRYATAKANKLENEEVAVKLASVARSSAAARKRAVKERLANKEAPQTKAATTTNLTSASNNSQKSSTAMN